MGGEAGIVPASFLPGIGITLAVVWLIVFDQTVNQPGSIRIGTASGCILGSLFYALDVRVF